MSWGRFAAVVLTLLGAIVALIILIGAVYFHV